MNSKVGNRPQYMIKRGDKVRITAMGAVRTGIVKSSDFDSAGSGYWLIELDSEEAGYCYWQQRSDGGTVQLLEVGPELPTWGGILRTHRDHTGSVDAMMESLQEEFPDMIWSPNRAFHDAMCSCLSWDVSCPGWPIVTVYLYTLWNDDQSKESDLLLIGEEAMQMMDWVYGGGAAHNG